MPSDEGARGGLTGNRWFALGASTIFVFTVGTAAWIYYSRAPGVDFASFWAAGRLALLGQPALAYDAEAHRAVEMTVANMRGLMPFPYPPPFLFAVVPFGFHPYWLAYLAWMLATAGLYFAATKRFLPTRFAFAHPAAVVNAVIGQNGFLTSSLFLFGISVIATSPFAGGAILGLLVVKPQLGVLLPVALCAAREWRAIGGAAVSSVALIALAALVFGAESYRAFLEISRDYASFMAADRWNWAEQASIFGFLRFLGAPQALALAGQAVAALAAAIVTWRAWRLGLPNRAGILAAGTMLVPPYVFTYDSLLLILPASLLLRDSNRWWRPAVLWVLLLVPLLGHLGLYPGPNTVPLAAILCLWWLGQKEDGGAFRHRRPFETKLTP
ncbi:MAG TPA: glycosyltransferase family 87 protein [Sphingomicrobium sp.]|nr:glycosyltransferase family 87 protein [Sphingomicrobium sp.]